jgi:GNAT superfamily N-acetyltransferase
VGRRMTGAVDLTLDNLAELPPAVRSCVYWELDAPAATRAAANGAGALEKEAWFSNTLLEWGTCGKAVYADGKMAGCAIYAPPAYVPRAGSFPTSPVAADSVILMALMVFPAHRGRGLGRALVQGVARISPCGRRPPVDTKAPVRSRRSESRQIGPRVTRCTAVRCRKDFSPPLDSPPSGRTVRIRG